MGKGLPNESHYVRRVVEGGVEDEELGGAVLELLEADDCEGVAYSAGRGVLVLSLIHI